MNASHMSNDDTQPELPFLLSGGADTTDEAAHKGDPGSRPDRKDRPPPASAPRLSDFAGFPGQEAAVAKGGGKEQYDTQSSTPLCPSAPRQRAPGPDVTGTPECITEPVNPDAESDVPPIHFFDWVELHKEGSVPKRASEPVVGGAPDSVPAREPEQVPETISAEPFWLSGEVPLDAVRASPVAPVEVPPRTEPKPPGPPKRMQNVGKGDDDEPLAVPDTQKPAAAEPGREVAPAGDSPAKAQATPEQPAITAGKNEDVSAAIGAPRLAGKDAEPSFPGDEAAVSVLGIPEENDHSGPTLCVQQGDKRTWVSLDRVGEVVENSRHVGSFEARAQGYHAAGVPRATARCMALRMTPLAYPDLVPRLAGNA